MPYENVFFSWNKVQKYVHDVDINAWWDFIRHARFVLPQTLIFFLSFLSFLFLFFFLLQKFSSWPFWSEQDLFHALTAREPLAGLRLAIMPQTALLLLFLQAYTNAERLPPTAFPVRPQSHQKTKQTTTKKPHICFMQILQENCFLSYKLLQFMKLLIMSINDFWHHVRNVCSCV